MGVIVSTGAQLNISSSAIINNGTGLRAQGASVRMSDSDFAFNGVTNNTGFTGTINSLTNNRFSNNGALGTLTAIGSPTQATGLQ